jgi:gamma-glutamylcyclotransferase (GGCT)/AIG2-like uncharacterized protein YtfP
LVVSSGMRHHANVIGNGRSECRVEGTVFEITDDELALADRYERAANYRRQLVTMHSGTRAWVYTHASPD